MFKKNDKKKSLNLQSQEISTLIGEGYVITGEVAGKSVIRIDGKVIGNVKAEGGIILGETGVIEGDLFSQSAIIFGTVNGNVDSTQLEIKKSGCINGDIKTDTLEIELGAQFNGKLSMNKQIEMPQETKELLQDVG